MDNDDDKEWKHVLKDVLFKKMSGHAGFGGRPSYCAEKAWKMDIIDISIAAVILNIKYTVHSKYKLLSYVTI